MKSKKILNKIKKISLALSIVAFAGMSAQSVFADTRISDSYYQLQNKSKTSQKQYSSSRGISLMSNYRFIHNNGLPMKTDLIDLSQNPLNEKVFGVLIADSFEAYYSSNDDKVLVEEVEKKLVEVLSDYRGKMSSQNMKQITTEAKFSSSSLPSLGKPFDTRTWVIDLNVKNQNIEGTVYTEFYNRGNASVDGKQVTIWDVIVDSNATATTVFGQDTIANQVMRIDVSGPNQKLRDWAPRQDISGGSIDLSLSKDGPTVGWSMDITGYKVTDLTRSAQGYGRWRWNDNLLTFNKQLNVKPGVRAYNGAGAFQAKVSNTYHISFGQDFQTGVKTYYYHDR